MGWEAAREGLGEGLEVYRVSFSVLWALPALCLDVRGHLHHTGKQKCALKLQGDPGQSLSS